MEHEPRPPREVPFLYLFIYDARKSETNAGKHAIDFEQAQAIWWDARHVVAPARYEGEARWLVIGRVDDRLWSAIVTARGGAVRIISVRRARPKEKEFYEGRGS